ncbi:hypothetical protein OB956_02450 [Aeromonas dhakensis]|uniref:hypothetical protein n=1 Tax=Aeromonas dhakensis TaxID=196024 RepID=UPI00259F525B|nr:hypothetical protein [Aeromonas dhakensis]MDM5053149.1 hypothetical protein [Aeromonas dhakensis]MDM5078958.1 hypothetical protein [Aeromonas dhakensis]
MSGFNRLLKNSVANIINGFSNAILGIVISPFILANLSLEQFSVWSLILQSGIFISLLGFGSQIAVGRYTSLAKFTKNESEFEAVMSNALVLSLVSLFLSFITIAIVVSNFSFFMPQLVHGNEGEYKLSFIIVCLSFSFGLISSVFSGYFTGIERNDILALVNLTSRVFLGIIVVISSKYGLLPMAITYLLVNIFSYAVIFLCFKRKERKRVSLRISSGMRSLLSFCGGLAIWNMAQYFISGTGGFIVGKYDVSNLAYYMLALTMINAIVGVIGALINPIIQPIVKLNSLQRKDDVDKLVITLSFLFGLFIIVGVNISHYISEFVLSIWIGIDKAEQTNIIFNYLLVAFAIRMVISPYGMKMVSEGRQLSISHYPLAESVLNFILSIYFVIKYGALGIAYATTCAALVLMLAYIYRYTLDCNLDKKYILVSTSFFIIPLAAVINVFFLESSKLYSNAQTVMIIQSLVLIPVAIFIIRGIKDVKRLVNSI